MAKGRYSSSEKRDAYAYLRLIERAFDEAKRALEQHYSDCSSCDGYYGYCPEGDKLASKIGHLHDELEEMGAS
jgi:hypothetical protein